MRNAPGKNIADIGHCGGCSRLEPVREGIGPSNPVLVHALGICSALAVTGLLETTLVMCGALLFVAAGASFLVSLLRTLTPHRVRLMMQMLVIASLVIVVDQVLQAYAWEISKKLGVYVGLIITNCIILGRTESFALRNGPIASAYDGFAAALGYSAVLVAIALIREPLGSGTLLGYEILPAWLPPVRLLKDPAGAFVALACIVWIVRAIWPAHDPAESHPEADPE